jgi:hypothetical protein
LKLWGGRNNRHLGLRLGCVAMGDYAATTATDWSPRRQRLLHNAVLRDSYGDGEVSRAGARLKVVDIGNLPAEESCCGQWPGSAIRRQERELGMTGNDVFHAALLLVHRAPRDTPAALLPAPLGSQHPHRIVRSGPGVGSSTFYGCDKNVIKDLQPSVSCQRPGATCPPLRSHVS